jgi:hypothetical protein
MYIASSVADPRNFGTDPDADSFLWLMDPDADLDPAIFVSDLQDVHKKLFFSLKGIFTLFFKYKKW